jgi:hypothetical protein
MANHGYRHPFATQSIASAVVPLPVHDSGNGSFWFESPYNLEPGQCSPTVAGTSVQEEGETSFEVSTTSSTNHNDPQKQKASSGGPSTKRLRRQPRRSCARCSRRKIKCILGKDNTCTACNNLGLSCDMPSTRGNLSCSHKDQKGVS